MIRKHPDTVSVGEAAEIMRISTSEVRKLCRNGDLKAVQSVDGSPQWSISTEQLTHLEGWKSFLEEIEVRKKHSKILIEALEDILKEMEND